MRLGLAPMLSATALQQSRWNGACPNALCNRLTAISLEWGLPQCSLQLPYSNLVGMGLAPMLSATASQQSRWNGACPNALCNCLTAVSLEWGLPPAPHPTYQVCWAQFRLSGACPISTVPLHPYRIRHKTPSKDVHGCGKAQPHPPGRRLTRRPSSLLDGQCRAATSHRPRELTGPRPGVRPSVRLLEWLNHP